MENKVFGNNEKVTELFADKDFMSKVLKMKNSGEVQKAFEEKGVKFDQKDVEDLGKALSSMSDAINKCSPEEINKMANAFETVDPKQLVKVVGGSGTFWDTFTEGVANILLPTGQNTDKIIAEVKKVYGDKDLYDPDRGGLQEGGKEVLRRMQIRDDKIEEIQGFLGGLVKKFGSKSKTAPAPAPTLGAPSIATSPSNNGGKNNNGMYVVGAAGIAVAALGIAYMFRDNIKGWFNK